MKIFGLCLLICGFVWTAIALLFLFTAANYAHGVYLASSLSGDYHITRSAASGAIRNMQLFADSQAKHCIIPCLVMLLGGLFAGLSKDQLRSSND